MEFSKKIKSLQFLIVQGSLNPNITFLGEKLWPVAWKQTFTSVIFGKNLKITIKSVKMKISKKRKKNTVFSRVPRITQPKNWVPMSKDVPCSLFIDGHADRVNTLDTLSNMFNVSPLFLWVLWNCWWNLFLYLLFT